MYLYSGKIKCVNCGHNYRGKKQRAKKVYVCGGYHNKKSNCPRFTLEEDELTDIIVSHFKSVYRYEFQQKKYEKENGEFFPSEYMKRVEVNSKQKSFKIIYEDKSYDSIRTLNEFIV